MPDVVEACATALNQMGIDTVGLAAKWLQHISFFTSSSCYMVRVIIKYSPNAHTHGYRYGRPTNARTGVQGKRVRASDRFWNGRLIERVRSVLMLPHTCERHLIPVNDTYEWHAFKSNESAYKGVQLRISTKEFDREKMSICLALRATQEVNCSQRWHTKRFVPSGTDLALYQNGRPLAMVVLTMSTVTGIQ